MLNITKILNGLYFMCYDKLIDKLFFKGDIYNLSNVIKFNRYKNTKYKNIKTYLDHRYIDSFTHRETIYRIHYQIEQTPLCPICKSNRLKFYGKKNIIFSSHCSHKCKKMDNLVNQKWKTSCGELGTNRQKAKQTLKDKYGVENPYQIPKVIQHIKDINKKLLPQTLEKIKNTNNKKYGVDYYVQTNEFKNKRIKTSIQKYGTNYPIQSSIVKNKYNWEEITKKIILTKEKNNTFNTSKDEELSYIYLKERYSDVIRQYNQDKRYPFLCDFYIPSLDLFIECQYGWQHGNHPFDNNNQDDLNRLEMMKSKNTRYYNNVIKNWIIRDVHKRNIAKENKLNYLEFWNIKELKIWIDKNYEL